MDDSATHSETVAGSPAISGPPSAAAGLGARWDGTGVHFALVSRDATAVELCLFDDANGEETARWPLAAGAGGIWSARVPGVGPGQLYGYRVHGPFRPAAGLRFNPAKLLLDPRALAVRGSLWWSEALLDHPPAQPGAASATDSAPFVPKSMVVDPAFDWGDDRPPAVPRSESVIYECHVKGMTRRHPAVPEELRGTYLGLASESVLDHLRQLGVTAVELLPVAQNLPEPHLARSERVNYWGYSPVALFAPHGAYATDDDGRQVREFKQMVRRLHAAGIEVILDVVFNHTAEGGTGGPTFCLRGLDNAVYYRLDPHDRRRYIDVTGCGHTIDLEHPTALGLVLEALRYWAVEMRVDGFRFDLAPALARGRAGFDPAAPFLAAVGADPILSRLKLIAEPWDLGLGGYRLGQFPLPWAEWNDRFRDAVRSFWRGDPGRLPELAARLAGSRDLFPAERRGAGASIDFVTSHDGFTLRDLVSYERKHNQANGEDGRDGTDHNVSRNWGVEGPTADSTIAARRDRVLRSFLATLALTGGVPMLSHGDELGRSQRGNNNAYCQDNELIWLDWELDQPARSLLAFARRAFALRSRARLGRPGSATRRPSGWLTPGGRHLTAGDWIRLEARAIAHRDGDLLLLLNSAEEPARFHLPRTPRGRRWQVLLDSGEPEVTPGTLVGAALEVAGSGLVLLELATASMQEDS